MTILVTGATGNVGRRVVDQLVRAGQTVRALTRNPAAADLPSGVSVVQGDLAQPETLPAALVGVEKMLLFPVPDTVREVVDLVRKAGVRRIVVLSSGAVTAGYDTHFHFPVERAVEESGLEWTHVRPGEFALNKLYLWGPSISKESRVVDPYPDVVDVPTHEWDISDVATVTLLEDGHAGQAYTFVGPEALTHREQVSAIAAAIGRAIRLDEVTPQQARDYYLKQGGWAAANADYLLGFEDYSGTESVPEEEQEWDKVADVPESTAEEVTGKPARTFAEWARDHAADFR